MKDNSPDPRTIKVLQDELNVSNLCARILYSQGFTEPGKAAAFLSPKLADLSDPFLLPDMEKAVQRVILAMDRREKICLYGDYDADGVTSTALVVNFFRHLGIKPDTYLPERKEGYGLSAAAVRRLAAEGVGLLVCLDCGSTNVAEVREANSSGMEVIIIDHHEPGEELPPAYAIINPKRKDARFPTRELAACGVTFFFLLGLRRILAGQGRLTHTINLKNELDLVTVGTVADMVPLTGDNRIIAKFGMEVMRKKPRTWLRSFLKSGIAFRGVDEFTLGFIIIPRINASGRVSKPDAALDFLLCEDEGLSAGLLAALHEVNKQRQRIEQTLVKEAVSSIESEDLGGRNSIVLFKEDWHIGVIGIVAQKLTEMYRKPAIVITEVDGLWKGSGRGGEGIDLHETIESVAHLLLKFGGHKYACGVSLLKENLVPFRDAFDAQVQGAIKDKARRIRVDTHADFGELTEDLVTFMDRASPFGMGNPRPNLLLAPASVTLSNRFVKITDEENRTWYGTMQGQDLVPETGKTRIVASPVVREDMGERFIHLTIKDFMPL